MTDFRFERHMIINPALPFIFHTDFVSKSSSGYANWHDNTEFLHCIEGSGCVHCDNKEIPFTEGDTIIINARCLHKFDSPDNVTFHCLIIDNSFFKDNGIVIDNLIFKDRFYDKTVSDYIQNIALCFTQQSGEFSIAKKRLSVLNFVCYICDNYAEKKPHNNTKFTKSYAAVIDAIEFINENFRQKLTIDNIASNSGFSRYHFSRIFKENTGLTIIEYINTKRCEYAGILLRDTSLEISHISFACGFESPSYFAKTFKSFYGILPSEYREKHSKI